MENVSVDPLEGWTMGYRLNTIGEVADANLAISPYLSASENSTVTYYNPTTQTTSNRGIWTYDENLVGTFLAWGSRENNEHSFTMPTGRTKFRITMLQATLDDAYIKDDNGNYIWKGKNV